MTFESFGGLLGPRSVEDILAERVRVTIGDEIVTLPVLTIAENRAWKEQMDLQLGYLLLHLSLEDDSDRVLRLFDGTEITFLDLLVAYDKSHLLPDRAELEQRLTQMGLIRAVLEVWRAARPLADIASIGMATLPTEVPQTSWRKRMSTWLERTAGRRVSSSAS